MYLASNTIQMQWHLKYYGFFREEYIMTTATKEEQIMSAFYLVGNNDTEHDIRAWWKQYGDLYDEVFADENNRKRSQEIADELWIEKCPLDKS